MASLPFSVEAIRGGRNRLRDPPRVVRTGALDARVGDATILGLSSEGRELLRSVFVAVRDEQWGTVPGVVDLTEWLSDRQARFAVRHESSEVSFAWTGELAFSDESLSFRMRGHAGCSFRYCRIGLNVVHPANQAGAHYACQGPDGAHSGVLPEVIDPVRFENGVYVPMIAPFTRIELDLGAGALCLHFEGDLFETEDQRNWTDASFKTYSTPLALGFPHDAHEGQEFFQRFHASWHRA